jgi:hypothetical protein
VKWTKPINVFENFRAHEETTAQPTVWCEVRTMFIPNDV